MGRKQNRTGQYLHLFVACVIFMSLQGCATSKEMGSKRETCEYLVKAQKLLEQEDYEGSLKENQKVLSLYGNVPPGDEALFNMGLIYTYYRYSKRDYQKSLDCFKRLIKVFPQSPLVVHSKIWIGMLQENERLNMEVEELKKTLKKSKQVDIEIDEKKKELSK